MMNNKGKYLYFLDFVRFMAAFWVMGYHFAVRHSEVPGLGIVASSTFHQLFLYGNLGVPIFFIISGFVIMQSADGRGWKEFTLLRLFRLLPLYWVGLLIVIFALIITPRTVFVGNPLFVQFAQSLSLENPLLTLFNIFNQIILLFDDLIIRGCSYLLYGKQIKYSLWVGQAWSLRIELKFYFCIIILLFLFKNLKSVIYWIILLYGIISLCLDKYAPLSPWGSFFALGILIYMYQINPNAKRLLLILIQTAVTCYIEHQAYHQMFVLSPEVPSAENIVIYVTVVTVLIMLFFINFRKFDELCNTKAIKILGAWSYPLYIIHELPGVFLIKYLAQNNVNVNVAIIMAMFIMLILAVLLDTYFDKKVQNYAKQLIYKYKLRK